MGSRHDDDSSGGDAASTKTEGEDRPHPPDFPALLGAFMDAMCVLETGIRALEARGEENVADVETVTLRHGMTLLSQAYTNLDLALGGLLP